MSRSAMVTALLLSLGISACAQTPTPTVVQSAPSPAADTEARCEASKASVAIGQSPAPEVVEQARMQAGAEMVRVLRHDQPITKEYRYGRLNLVLDASGRIASVNCS